MSRAKKLCEEINAVVEEYGNAYLVYNITSGLSVTPVITQRDVVVIIAFDEISEAALLDQILMLWEDESDSSTPDCVPNYLVAMRGRLWSDYNVD